MTTAIWVLTILLVAEFVMAPINLWTGRTMPLFTGFTGYPPSVATRVFAPVKLLGAVLSTVGLFVPVAGVVGAAILTAVCALYLVRLAQPGRRSGSGIGAFLLFGSWALGVLILDAVRSAHAL
ncbi:hypothetical protein GCM10009665_17290 [Kitasatospora nipponensis]|uniref:DoxX-like protein n=1 Tax=Kitasatospora nipponensis TaxID=258049 RepID=A0ABN1W3F9_9ACTN